MTTRSASWSLTLGACVGFLLTSACAVTGVGYDQGGYYDGVGYVGGFYEPYGYEYGGWDGRYRVGPPRGDGRGYEHGGGAHGGFEHGGHGAPSIPSGARGGGGHGGGHSR